MKLTELRRFYECRGIPSGRLRHDAPEVRRILRQIKSGESRLAEVEDWPIRVVRAIIVILKKDITKDVEHILIESERIFKDGTVVKCHMTDGIGMKMIHNETPHEAADRCLRTKVGIKTPIKFINYGVDLLPMEDTSPLPTHVLFKERFFVKAVIPDSLYKSGGYESYRSDRKIIFRWIPRWKEGHKPTE